MEGSEGIVEGEKGEKGGSGHVVDSDAPGSPFPYVAMQADAHDITPRRCANGFACRLTAEEEAALLKYLLSNELSGEMAAFRAEPSLDRFVLPSFCVYLRVVFCWLRFRCTDMIVSASDGFL